MPNGETQEDMAAFEGSPLYMQLMGKIAGLMAAPPAGKSYEFGVLESREIDFG